MKVLIFSLFKANSALAARISCPVWSGDTAEEVAQAVVKRATRVLDCEVSDLTHVEFYRDEHHF